MCVVALITLHHLMHILKYEMDFFLIIWGGEKIGKKKGSRMRVEASHFLMIWRVLLLIKLIQIRTPFVDNISHLISYF